MEYAGAVQFLLNEESDTIVRAKPIVREKKPFEMPRAYMNMDRVKDYLCNVRSIDKDIIQGFVDKKMIFESADYHNAVFVGFDKNGVTRHANKRGYSKKAHSRGTPKAT